MAGNQHKKEAQGLHGAPADWARAVIMSAMLGIVLLAAVPALIGHPPAGQGAAELPPLLNFVRGI